MYLLQHFLRGGNIDHEFATIGITDGSAVALSRTNWFTEDDILDALCHHGDVAVQAMHDDNRFAIKDSNSGFFACCSISKNLKNSGYFLKVYYVGQGEVRGIDDKYIIVL